MQLYQKLFKALDDNDIDELGILPFTPELDQLPLNSQPYFPFALIETKLGIAWAEVSGLLRQTHIYFITLDIDKNPTELENVTRVMILLKPDNYTAMNTRKRLIQLGHIDPKKELDLIKLVFTVPRHSKSSTAWHHRQWILSHFESTLEISKELELCEFACAAYPRNYYAWTHRTFLLNNFQSLMDLSNEYNTLCRWIELHTSDYSSFNHLQQIIERLAVDQDQTRQEQHMQWLNQLIIKYPGHESLWCHRRFCSHLFVKSKDYCHAQHQFIQSILSDQHKDEALSNNEDSFKSQREQALKFGLWQSIMEKRTYGQVLSQSLLEDYARVAPIANFL
ncbi:hypothetical protein EDC96DRAFT_520653 [Choanephora cucurbitarum]|nr:hypothetical protein EDC96DRAFT_520653 [Choanephora cucurbitarum]